MSTHTLRIGPALLMLALLAQAGTAGAITIIPIDGFESGAGAWTTVGDVRVIDASYGVTPTEGSQQILLTSDASQGAVSVSAQEGALGLNNNTIQRLFRQLVRNVGQSSGDDPIEGSAIQISFSANALDVLAFDFDLLTDELDRSPAQPGLFTDFVWMHLDPPSGQPIRYVPAHVNQGGLTASGTGEFSDETGPQSISFNLSQTGTYTLTLGVADVEDAAFNSGVIFDNFRLIEGPEPDTFLLVGGGLLGMAWRARHRRAR